MSLKDAPGFYNPTVQAWQGANSKTFTPPGLDTNLTLPELFEFHAKHSSEHPVFVYADDDQKEHVINFPEVYRAIRKSATLVTPHYTRLAARYSKSQEGKSENDPPIIGILANAGACSIIIWLSSAHHDHCAILFPHGLQTVSRSIRSSSVSCTWV